MKLKTIKLLVISIVILGLTILVATFWEAFGFGTEESIFLTFPILIAFGISIAGIILGFIERKVDNSKALIGIFGNSLVILAFCAMLIYSLLTPIQ